MQAATAMLDPNDSLDRRIRAEQIRMVYLHSPTTTGGSLVAGAFLLWAVWRDISAPVLIVWTIALLVHQAIRVYHYRSYLRANPGPVESERWGRLYIFATTIAGLIWGSAGVLFYVPESISAQTYLCLILFGIASLTIPSISIFAPAFYPLVILVLTPFIVRALVAGTTHEAALAIPLAIALMMSLAFGRKINLLVHDSIRRRFENLDLIAALQRQKEIAESARQQAEAANRSKTQFFAAASHDLRQPLHAMGLFAAALVEKVHDPDALQVVNSINASVDALEGLFNELLDISKIDSGAIRAEPIDFPASRVLDRLRLEFEPEAFGKGLSFKVMPTKSIVRSDPILVERILRNLASNAIRYTREGGIVIGCRRHGDGLRFEVWDTGIGIPADQQERIFDEFYQVGNPERSSRKGLGLGLSIVRRLAALIGARIELSSRAGKGSVFRFDVPVGQASAAAAAAQAESQHAPLDLRNKLIVVIDDEPAIVEGMRVLLSGWGADVLGSSSGDDVVERIHEVGRLPDLIIADYRLAEGHTGTDVIERLRQELEPEIPAILVTGSTTPDRVEEAKSHRYHLLLKPVLPAKLRTLINFKLKRGTHA